MSSAYPIRLSCLWECVLYLIIIIKSEVCIVNHCLGLGHETMVCAACLTMFLSILAQIGRFRTVTPVWIHWWIEMMHKAWWSVEELPYYFSGSSIKFQGHTGWKIDNVSPIWVRLLGRSQLSNPSDLPCYETTSIYIYIYIHTPVVRPVVRNFRWHFRLSLHISIRLYVYVYG